MSQFLPLAQLGPFIFSSGASNPKAIDGQKRTNYVREHEVPGGEGGNVEYAGSQQPTYRLQGFFAPLNDSLTSGGTAGAIVSGQSAVFATPEQSISYFVNLKGSGAQLLQLESTWSRQSGYPIMYENDFFYIANETFAMEPGRGYSYYPYTLDLFRATYRTYGSISGSATYNPSNSPYLSGAIISWNISGGLPNGEFVIGLGVYIASVASGHAQVAVYSGLGAAFKLVAASASQNVHSGWNYFPINPSFTTTSGQTTYSLALMGDVYNTSGYTILQNDTAGGTTFSYGTGFTYANGFPASWSPAFPGVSGNNPRLVMVVAA